MSFADWFRTDKKAEINTKELNDDHFFKLKAVILTTLFRMNIDYTDEGFFDKFDELLAEVLATGSKRIDELYQDILKDVDDENLIKLVEIYEDQHDMHKSLDRQEKEMQELGMLP